MLPVAMDDFSAHVYRSPAGEALPYRLHLPAPYDPERRYPLVLFLHGAGERGDDNRSQLRHGVRAFTTPAAQARFPALVVAPQCPLRQQWVDTPFGADAHDQPGEPSPPLRLALELLDALQRQYGVDPARLYVTGISMGGFGTWDAVARHPGRFAAAVPVCGGGDEKAAPRLLRLPVWAFHGAADPVVKPRRSRHMVEALKQAGGAPRYTEYPGVGHACWDQAYGEPALLPWLFSQSLPPR